MPAPADHNLPSRWPGAAMHVRATLERPTSPSPPGYDLLLVGAAPPPQHIDLTTLHPLAHRMGEALDLLRGFVCQGSGPALSYDDGMRRARLRVAATRDLLREAGMLPPAEGS